MFFIRLFFLQHFFPFYTFGGGGGVMSVAVCSHFIPCMDAHRTYACWRGGACGRWCRIICRLNIYLHTAPQLLLLLLLVWLCGVLFLLYLFIHAWWAPHAAQYFGHISLISFALVLAYFDLLACVYFLTLLLCALPPLCSTFIHFLTLNQSTYIYINDLNNNAYNVM